MGYIVKANINYPVHIPTVGSTRLVMDRTHYSRNGLAA